MERITPLDLLGDMKRQHALSNALRKDYGVTKDRVTPPKKLDLSYSGLDEFKETEFKAYGSEVSEQESNVVCDKKSDDSKENSDDSLVKEHVSKDTSSFVESSLNVDKETVFPVDKKVEIVKPKNHEKPVKKLVRYLEIFFCTVLQSTVVAKIILSNKFPGIYFSFKFGISGLLHQVITTIADRIRGNGYQQKDKNKPKRTKPSTRLERARKTKAEGIPIFYETTQAYLMGRDNASATWHIQAFLLDDLGMKTSQRIRTTSKEKIIRVGQDKDNDEDEIAHEGPSDTRDTKIAALRLKFNAFKALEGENVNGTFTRLKCLLNDLENKGGSIPQSEVDATFINSLPRKWLSMNQTQRANNSIKNDSLATLTGDSDVEEDTRSSSEFLTDLNAEFHDRALLANQKRFFKRSGRVGSSKKPMDKSNETCFACGKLGHFQKDYLSNKTSTPSYPSLNKSYNKPKFHSNSTPQNNQNVDNHQKVYKGKYKDSKLR
ncbi:retrovirus-related pol polyprotein from transposon TNT 1-94 [Tanacetum coccineum]